MRKHKDFNALLSKIKERNALFLNVINNKFFMLNSKIF